MKVAIQGCCHGDLDTIYDHIAVLEKQNNYKVDLLLICGDFQAVRNWSDLTVMAVPDKYKEIKDFHKYYSGARTAPILTIVIGGNHEASNYLWELYHGGWLAPNIYFLGHAGSILVNGIRISGASGIFKDHDFRHGHHERAPYDRSTQRSIYHIREYCIRKLSLLPQPDIFISHDWPQSIERYGDLRGLLRHKRHLKADIDAGRLGSPPLMGLLKNLKPRWWFAAHLHTRFEATVPHNESIQANSEDIASRGLNPDEIILDDENEASASEIAVNSKENNPDEIILSCEEQQGITCVQEKLSTTSVTKFLALDKCLPNRRFLEVVDVPILGSTTANVPDLTFDPVWLAITRALHPNLSLSRVQGAYPTETHARTLVERELTWVKEEVPKKLDGGWAVLGCQRFTMTAPPIGPEESGKISGGVPQHKPPAAG
ncbi:hypothetical protein H0H93_006273 [Arthromyces matolae]|nr:hypothetical protein H0H93_006273 [Arthromyces matolae]